MGSATFATTRGGLLRSRSCHLHDFANRSPIPIGHWDTQELLGACGKFRPADPLRRMQVEHTLGQMKPFALLSQIGELLEIGALGWRGEKSEMQTARIDYSLGKWVLCDGRGERFDGKNMYMWFEPTALHNSNGKLPGKSRQILFGAVEYGVATLNICLDLLRTHFFQDGDKFLHRQRAVATDIDATKEGNVGIHSVTV